MTALKMVVDVWQTPPPIPSTYSPSRIIFASRKPFSFVLLPTTLLNETSSPAFIIKLLNFDIERDILCFRCGLS